MTGPAGGEASSTEGAALGVDSQPDGGFSMGVSSDRAEAKAAAGVRRGGSAGGKAEGRHAQKVLGGHAAQVGVVSRVLEGFADQAMLWQSCWLLWRL